MRRLTVVLFSLILLCSTTLVAHAQLSSFTPENSAQLNLTPRFPEPGETVVVTLNDYSFNTNGASINWFINGEPSAIHNNKRTLSYRAGELGTSDQITAQINLSDNTTIPVKTTITPIRTDLLIEANTLTPQFYSGRALPTSGSVVRVTALPFTGNSSDPTQYNYTWTVGEEVINGGSERGQNSTTFRSQFETEVPVNVDIYTKSGTLLTSKRIIVPITNPELYFYEVNPLRGLLETALSPDSIFVGEEMRIRAVPYFFDTTIQSQNTHIEWELNGQTISNPSENPLELTLRRQGSEGSFRIGFHIRNLRQLLQGIEDSITLTF